MKYIRTEDKIFTNKNPNGDKEVYTARYREEDIIKQALTTKSKKELAFDKLQEYITELYNHRNDYKEKELLDYEIDNAIAEKYLIEEIYKKMKEVLSDES